jgi:hypothetical protein
VESSEVNQICAVFGDHFTSVGPFPDNIAQQTNIIFCGYYPNPLLPKVIVEPFEDITVPIHTEILKGDKFFIQYLNKLPTQLQFINNSISTFFETTLLEPFLFLKSCGCNSHEIFASYVYHISPDESLESARALIKNCVLLNSETQSTNAWNQYIYLGIFAIHLKKLLEDIKNLSNDLFSDVTNLVSCVPLKCKDIYPILLKAVSFAIQIEKLNNDDEVNPNFHRIIIDIVGPKKYCEFCQLLQIDSLPKFENFPKLYDGFFKGHLLNQFNFGQRTKLSQFAFEFRSLDPTWENQQFNSISDDYQPPNEFISYMNSLTFKFPFLL